MKRTRIPSLDGVRAISILLVIAGHWTETHTTGVKADIAGAFANLGVRIFFVLSGYLITRLLLEEQATTGEISLRQFYLRRARRILPASLFFMLTVFIWYHRELRWQHALAALLYVTNFDPGHPWFLGHLWSLSVEEQFYFLWPAVFKKWQAHRAPILGSDRLRADLSHSLPPRRMAWPRRRNLSRRSRRAGSGVPSFSSRLSVLSSQ
jgi:peptidoglycan/LPS O-acetylase OafA/YrhL